MYYPSSLKLGDTVGLITPCSPITAKRLSQCISTITTLGFSVVLGESCTKNLHGYLAGTDEERANDIHTMFANPKIKAIICIRGGYGSTRIMECLDYELIKNHPKIFVGYSDVTAFHLAFHSLCNFITFHGPMVSSNMVDDFDSYTETSFFTALSMPQVYPFKNPANLPLEVLIPGFAKGRVIGGCLSLVSPSIGTFYQPNFKGKILFLEDVGETLPRCDKLMEQLHNSGILDQVSGILLGNFKDCSNPSDPSYTIYDYFKEFFHGYKKPVLYGVQSGHDTPMGTIPFGTICSLETTNSTICFHYQ